MIDVSIIIVNYHTSDQIADCIESVRKLSHGFEYEIIIVDNNSEPALKQVYNDQVDVTVLLLPENVGFGRANNAGFDIAKGRYVFCLNPDTILLNNAIGILVDFMDTHPEAAACGGNLYDTELKPTLSFRRILPGLKWEINEFFNRKIERSIYKSDYIFNNTGQPIEVGYITGADLLIRKEVIDKVGGFDSRFFMYYEETDLCNRIKKHGGKIFSVPSAKIQHLEGGSFKETGVNYNRLKRSEEGRKTYNSINFSPARRLLVNTLCLSTLITRSILLPAGVKRDSWRYKLKLFFKS
ncbi:MAG: glycosyltransferase family 2 protein [Bacteroides sp.]|nr:glycosyltransferase family 2 protein [Bacteroides sp.]